MAETDEDVLQGAPPGDPARHLDTDSLVAAVEALPDAPRNEGVLDLLVSRAQDHTRSTPQSALLSAAAGLAGDRWSLLTKYGIEGQLTVMRSDVARLIANGQAMSLFGDNLYVDLDLSKDNLPVGARVAIGECILQVTEAPHNGCKKFRQRFGLDATKLLGDKRFNTMHLRGIYMKVVQDGTAHVGQPILVLSR